MPADVGLAHEQLQGGYPHVEPPASDAALHRSHRVLRFDSASSEYDLAQAGLAGWPTLHVAPPADDEAALGSLQV